MKKLKKELKMEDFYLHQSVPWENIKEVMGKRRYNKFAKWMMGQTVPTDGVYPWDLERYLNMSQYGKPTYFD